MPLHDCFASADATNAKSLNYFLAPRRASISESSSELM